MPHYSTSLIQPAANEALGDKHVPFTAFLRIVPIRGKRFETVRDMEKIAYRVEENLEHLCSSGSFTAPVSFDFAKPVAFTPQFGDKTARLTIHGHACKIPNFTKTPDGLHNKDTSDGILTGPGGGNAVNRVPDPDVSALTKELKMQIESATGLPVYRMEVAGFIFGITGETFPL
jgi:hypothetical protein